MTATAIICSIIALLVGAAVSYFFIKWKHSTSNDQYISHLAAENSSLKSRLAIAESKSAISVSESSKTFEESRARYEALLKEANERCTQLDQKLQDAIEGRLDDTVKEQLAEAADLKKRLRDLEEEIEENEDDMADIKRKLRNKDIDIEVLEDSLAVTRKEKNELSDQLREVRDNLERKTEVLRVKMVSLEFVQEILTAPETSDSNEHLDNFVAEIRSFALGQLMDCYATLDKKYIGFGSGDFDQFRKYWHKRFDEWASVKKKSWINGKTTVAFVGEFSAGKTSIVNRILSQDDPTVPQLPVSTKATTAIATYIAGGSDLKFRFVTPDDKLKAISQETFTEKISKEYLDQIKGSAALIQYFVMTYTNPVLDGYSILDTPGFNSNDKNDAQRTMEVINECDALFWVFDVNVGTINRSSMQVIKENLNKPLYVVINKVDTKSEYEVQEVENLIRRSMAEEGLRVEKFIRFSTNAPLENIMEPLRSVRHTTAKEQYLADLYSNIENTLALLEEKVNEATKAYHDAETNGQQIDDRFNQQKKILFHHCNVAACIPHYEKHLFKKNNFEMTQDEFHQLSETLDNSRQDAEKMGDIYEEKTNSSYEIQQTWTTLSEAKNAWQQMSALKEQYRKITNQI